MNNETRLIEDTAKTIEKTTHFGYQTVSETQKTEKVKEVFDSVADNYDIMNDLMSMGIHRLWKRYAISLSSVRSGQKVLDLASGTGDLVTKFSHLVGDKGMVVMSDINSAMLTRGRDRMIDEGYSNNIEYVQVNAEEIPFQDNSFDCITIAFGLRNVTHKETALKEMKRVLKPGGRVLILEFSKPLNRTFRKFYNFYSFNILPKIGKLVAKDEESYQYLAESIRMHPNQATLKFMMEEAGFENCDVHNLTNGIVAIHRGYKF